LIALLESPALDRQLVGVGEARNRTAQAVRRTVPFGLFAQTLAAVWYLTSGYDGLGPLPPIGRAQQDCGQWAGAPVGGQPVSEKYDAVFHRNRKVPVDDDVPAEESV
jgi:hypothetical protein